MPKNRKVSKTANGGVTKSRPANKFRIGNRKSGVNANLMTTEDLVKVLTDKNKTRYKNNAVTVLTKRGVDIKTALAA